AKGEICLRNLIKDQCGSGAEAKRQLPINNIIPESANAIGKEYSVSEQFTNLYEVCKTIATQSEIGWRLAFDGTSLTLECYEGTDRSQTVQFSTSFDSLANGEFSDSSESFSNAIYVGGKGDNEERDIYEGENGTPSGLDRFESFDNQSSMTTESEYEAEALSMLTQYGQTIQMSGNGLAKCPYIYKEQYDVGDLITVAFSGKSAVVQILSVTEHWTWGNYNIQFSFGKPQNNLSEQLQLMLRKIQSASNKEKATESVKWYNVANVNSMPASDVTFNTIGFTGTLTANKTFTFYLDDEKTGAKSYNIYVKNLSGNFNLTLTTGRAGKTNYVLKGGVNLTGRILVDDEGNITSQGMTATSTVSSGNSQPVTSGGVAEYVGVTNSQNPIADCNDAVKSGLYYFRGASTAHLPTSADGYLSSLGDGSLYVQSYSDTYVNQILQDFYSYGSAWVRNCFNGTWSAWRKIILTSDLYKNKYGVLASAKLSSSGWYRIARLGSRSTGQSLKIKIITSYYYNPSSAHNIEISYGWLNLNVIDFARDNDAIFGKIRFCYNSNNNDKMAVYVHYNKNQYNVARINVDGCVFPDTVLVDNFVSDSITWENTKEFNLGSDGFYYNGNQINPTDEIKEDSLVPITSGGVFTALRGLETFYVLYGTPKSISLSTWGSWLVIGNIDGSGNFGFLMTIAN
ncbi:MAG: hypothetical protein II453_01125, partial [Alphaproteobacteria bacterium]|nr:hypothetical protein [Alphaproteobacteria bacterium]